jgi:hypothetical protein
MLTKDRSLTIEIIIGGLLWQAPAFLTARDKHSSLFCRSFSDEEKSFKTLTVAVKHTDFLTLCFFEKATSHLIKILFGLIKYLAFPWQCFIKLFFCH